MDKEFKNEVITDIFNRHVFAGQQCGLLVKTHGYRGISKAELKTATYLGLGQYGYEFKIHETGLIVRQRGPEIVKK